MKKLITVAAASICIFSFSSCIKEVVNGSGPEITQTRTTGNFTAIDLVMNATVYYTQDSVFKIEIKAQQNVANEIITEVSNNKLTIRLPWDTKLISYSPVSVIISAPAVSDFNVSGSGQINAGALSVSNSDFNVSGSGNISVASIITNDVDARVSGSGGVQINGGSTETAETDISGSGNADLLGVAAKRGNVNMSGSGESKLNVSDELDVHISGSGKVYYMGNPTISSSISGSGKLIHL